MSNSLVNSRRYYGFTEREFVSRFRVVYVRPEYLDQLQSSGHDLSYFDLLSLIESGSSERRIRFAPPSFGRCPDWDRLYMPFDFRTPCKTILHAVTRSRVV